MSDTTNTTSPTNEALPPQPGEIIRAKWRMDGATTLDEAADKLEAFAAYLRTAHQQGWTLTAPIEDDYGFLVSPSGDAGWHDEPDDFDSPTT